MRRVAINVCDLQELHSDSAFATVILIQDFFDRTIPSELINLDNRHNIDEGAAVLNGKAAQDEKRLDALVMLLQSVIGPRKLGRRVRMYELGERGWKEIIPKKGVPKHA